MKSTKLTLEPFAIRLKTYLFWGFWVGVTFFSLYPTLNWLTSYRAYIFEPYLPWELAIPFIPGFIWLYLSMYLIFLVPPFFLNRGMLKRLAIELIIATIIAAFIFLLFPCVLGYERVLPHNLFYKKIYYQLFLLDKPYNLAPSLHVVYSVIIVISVTKNCNKLIYCGLYLWLIGLIVSTLLVHQHHLLDLITGLGLSWFIHQFMGRYYEKNSDYSIHVS